MSSINKRLKNKRGMTMGELLIVIAIIGVLAAVAFIAVWSHQRSLAQRECDDVAKELFVAAQNHLTPLYGQGYLGKNGKELGIPETVKGTETGETETETDVYYLVVHKGDLLSNSVTGIDSVINDILPFGSIDEMVRGGGNYVIRYQKSTGLVQDVFYCYDEDKKYGCNLNAVVVKNDGSLNREKMEEMLEDYRGESAEAKDKRREFKLGGDPTPVLGWYGASAESLKKITLAPPSIEVTNAERLYVTIFDSNFNNNEVRGEYCLKLIITGKTSGAQKGILAKKSSKSIELIDMNGRVDITEQTSGKYVVVLDDITENNAKTSRHFYHLGSDNDKTFIPGEDVYIRAVAYSNQCLSNIVYSGQKTTNSLFSGIAATNQDGKLDSNEGAIPNTAQIGNIRHLENLDIKISGVNYNASQTNKINISKAIQISDLDWENDGAAGDAAAVSARNIYNMMNAGNSTGGTSAEGGTNADGGTSGDGGTGSGDGGLADIQAAETEGKIAAAEAAARETASKYWTTHSVTNLVGASTETGCYMPISPNIPDFSYNGRNTLLKDEIVIHEIRNIQTKHTDSKKTEHAGLFGSPMYKNHIKNLKLIDFSVEGGSTAGALAGTLTGGTEVTNVIAYHTTANSKTATDKIVTAATAGGLIGKISGGKVTDCAAAMITGGDSTTTAGGLIGDASGTTVTSCYSGGHTKNGSYTTWIDDKKVYDVTGGTAGGLIGHSNGGTISNSYSTCSVNGSIIGGFVGQADGGSISGCYCTGLLNTKDIEGSTNGNSGKIGAFAGKLSGNLSGCGYLESINEVYKKDKNNNNVLDHNLGAVGDGVKSGITAIDADAHTYDQFVGGENTWNDAKPYDNGDSSAGANAHSLKVYYDNKYNLRTVDQLSALSNGSKDKASANDKKDRFVTTHYGDWPAPEIFIINTKN